MALAAVEEDVSAKEERLAAVESAASEIDLKVTALQAEVEDLNLPYKLVTSGRDCKSITTKEECLEAAKALGLGVTEAKGTSSWSDHLRPPGCIYQAPRPEAYLNLSSQGHADCGYRQHPVQDPWDCICKK